MLLAADLRRRAGLRTLLQKAGIVYKATEPPRGYDHLYIDVPDMIHKVFSALSLFDCATSLCAITGRNVCAALGAQ